jgi:hypothetical protein
MSADQIRAAIDQLETCVRQVEGVHPYAVASTEPRRVATEINQRLESIFGRDTPEYTRASSSAGSFRPPNPRVTQRERDTAFAKGQKEAMEKLRAEIAILSGLLGSREWLPQSGSTFLRVRRRRLSADPMTGGSGSNVPLPIQASAAMGETRALNAAAEIGAANIPFDASDRRAPREPVPPQGAGPHFAIGLDGRIRLASPSEIDAEGNHIGRIRQLLPLVRRAAEELAPHLTSNAFPELARNVAEYSAAIAGDEYEIPWGLVFGLGVMLENSADAARRKIEDRLLPSLEDAAQSALESLRTLHGPLILATGEGRELQEQADRLQMTRDEQLTLRTDTETLASALAKSSDVIDPQVADIVTHSVQTIGEGRFPERGNIFGIAAVRNVAIVLVSGSVLAMALPAGVAMGGTVGGIAAAGLMWTGYESLKKSKVFSAATAALGEKFDQLVEGGEAALAQRLASLVPFRRFVNANEDALRRIATNTRQLGWLASYVDFVVQSETKDVRSRSEETRAARDESATGVGGAITVCDLYRFGNATSPRLDRVRPNRDINVHLRDGIEWVSGFSGGVITSDAPSPTLRGSTLWRLPAGTNYDHLLLVVTNEKPHIWFWQPARDMPLADYVVALSALNGKFVRA